MKKSLVLAGLGLAFVQAIPAAGPVVISEFMAANSRTLADEDGDYEDWIELFNPGDAVVNLGSWFLTDSRSDLRKWEFPPTNLAPNQFLIVFASNKDRRAPGTNLHTNFRLAAGGEYLALVLPDGTNVASEFAPAFPPQAADVSYGLPLTASELKLLSAGAPGRFFVPPSDLLGSIWIRPEFDASSWAGVSTAVGFDHSGTMVLTPLADSVADWSPTGVQGDRGWTYGYYNKTADAAPGYHTNDFIPFPRSSAPYGTDNFWNGALYRWPSATAPWDTLGQQEVHPNGVNNAAEHWVIRRWACSTNGPLSITWQVRKGNTCGSGVTGKVMHNGAEVDSAAVAAGDTVGVTRTVTVSQARRGDFIDLALTPVGPSGSTDDGCDGSINSMVVSALSSLTNLLGTEVAPLMRGLNASAFLRLHFTITNIAELDRLTLRMRYDDGFVAWLNGLEVARRNAPSAGVAGTHAHQLNDWSATGQQGAQNWYYGYYNQALDPDSVYQPDRDFTIGDPQWAWNGTAWQLGASNPPWDFIGASSWHPNGDNSGGVHWVIRRWVSETAGTLTCRIAFAKENAACGNGATLRVFHQGVERFTRTVAYNATTGFTTNLVIDDVGLGDYLDFALDPMGTDGTLNDSCDGSTFGVSIEQITSSGLTWNASATVARPASQVTVPEDFDLTRFRDFLMPGTNLLAIQGLNVSAADADFFLLPELTATYFGVNAGQRVYFTQPTPRAINGAGSLTLGPIISEVKHAPNVPADADPLVVTCRLTPTLAPVGVVTLRYRVMFGAETSVPMFDDGAHGDGARGDGVWGATLPASASTPGQMVRYAMTASDTGGHSQRAPPDAYPLRAPQYFGTVVWDPALTNSRLPVLHWFIENPGAADSDATARCAVFFDGEFYDNVGANLHGQSSRGFPKKSYDFDFHPGYKFRWRDGEPRIDDFNFLSTWADKAHMRNVLGYETYSEAGGPSHFAFAMRVQQNGAFHSVANFVENGDDNFLKRLGLDPRGALYKMYNLADSTSGAEKKTRKNEGTGDLQALINGLSQSDATARQAYLFDHLDVPEVVNALAAKMITSDTDCCHKNYYLYRDTENTTEWQFMPWDVDLCFGRVWTCGSPCYAYYDETIYTNQSIFIGSGNRVLTPIFETPATRQMFLRRLRTLMDTLLQPPGTPATNDSFKLKTLALRDTLSPDAARDLARWGSWGARETITQAVNRIWNEFLPGRRLYLFRTLSVTNGGEIPLPQPADAVVRLAALEYRPANGNQAQEWLSVTNPNNYAVDVSGWRIEGGVRFTFKAGTVIPALGVAYVSPDVRAFRARTTAPTGRQRLLALGPYEGNLSAWGEGLIITDPTGRLVTTNYFGGNPSPAQRHLRITEIMYNPAPLAGGAFAEQEFEYLEFKNTGPAPLDLRGLRLTEGVQFDFTTAAITNLLPGARLLLARNTNAFAARYGAGLPVVGQFAGNLENKGEALRLEDAFGEKILQFNYDNRWYPITDGHGFSLVIVNDAAHWSTWGDAASWRPSGRLHGSPGGDDPIRTFPPMLVSEALTHTDPPLEDGVELNNPTASEVDISGWFLSDDFNTPKKFRLPPDTRIAPGGFRVFRETEFDSGGTGFALGSDGDEIWLFSADLDGGLTGYFHGFRFGAAENGVSFGRYLNSVNEEHFVAQSSNTLGRVNAYPKVGPVVISELMYHPPDAGTNDNDLDEFIELQNVAGQTVPLFDPTNTVNTWRLRNAVDFDFPANTTLPPGGRLLVVGFAPSNAALTAAFRATYGLAPSVPILGPWRGKLDNSDETLQLKKPDPPNGTNMPYVLVEEIHYRDQAPWPETADGVGASLQRRVLTAFANDPTHWFASAPTAGQTNAANQPPTVSLTAPSSGAVFQSPVNVTLTAMASDSDGAVTRVEFFANDVKLGENITTPFTWVWSNAPAGAFVLTAKARDDRLGIATSAGVPVTVRSQPPAVAIVGPTHEALFVATSTIAVEVEATDPDGAVSLVQLYAGADKLAESLAAPHVFAWSNAAAGAYPLWAVATDNFGLSSTSEVVMVAFTTGFSSNATLIPLRSSWNFLDTGANAGTNWRAWNFDDRGWKNGPAKLGYGDPDMATPIYSGPDPNNRYLTTYFRHAFQVMDSATVSTLTARLLRDDGAIVYLNGAEVFRSNMPTGAVNYLTRASVSVGGADETNLYAAPISPLLLRDGTNLVAVELHQAASNSSDLSFDLELTGVRSHLAPVILTSPTSQSVTQGSSVNLSVRALGSPPLSYQWRFNGGDMDGASQPSLAIANAQSTHSGTYSVVVRNTAGATTSAEALLQVQAPPTTLGTVRLLSLPQIWKFHQAGRDLGAAWRELDYDDRAWASGPALLGFEDSVPFPYAEPVRTPLLPPQQGGPNTIYFRTRFTVSDTASIVSLTASNFVDDGAIWYLNGAEVARVRLPDGPVAFATVAGTAEPEGQAVVTNFPIHRLREGENLLAVEVHQASTTSSDVVFGTVLDAVALRTRRPSLLEAQRLPDGSIRFTLEGMAGQRYVVDRSEDLFVWVPLATLTQGAGRTNFTDPSPRPRCNFYRARRVE